MAWCSAHEHQVVGGDASGELRLFDTRRAGTLHSFDLSDAPRTSNHSQRPTAIAAETSGCDSQLTASANATATAGLGGKCLRQRRAGLHAGTR